MKKSPDARQGGKVSAEAYCILYAAQANDRPTKQMALFSTGPLAFSVYLWKALDAIMNDHPPALSESEYRLIHELNNQLLIAMTHCEYLTRTDLPAQANERLEKIQAALSRMRDALAKHKESASTKSV